MTELGVTVYNRCVGHAGTAALIGTRCYPDRLPESVVYPAITYVAPVSRNDAIYRTHDNVNSPTTRTEDRVQLNCFAETRDGAAALATQVIQAWSGYKDGCDVGYCFVVNQIASREDAIEAYRYIVDVMIEHSV